MFRYLFIAVLALALFVFPKAVYADDTDLQQLMQDARTGSSTAQYLLGMKYLEGDGVAQDSAEANKWLTEAATRGHESAVKILSGNIDDPELAKALANGGNPYAQLALAKMYFNGIGIEQDLIEGYKWIHLSLMPPGLSGKERRKALILQGKWQYRMSMEDIRAAEQRAVDWHKGIR
jgi:hypothetical protein